MLMNVMTLMLRLALISASMRDHSFLVLVPVGRHWQMMAGLVEVVIAIAAH